MTDRERDILDGICRGLSNPQIAEELFVGPATVKTYVSRLLEKFATDSRVGLVIAAGRVRAAGRKLTTGGMLRSLTRGRRLSC